MSASKIVKEFQVGNKKVICYDGDFLDAVIQTVVETAKASIAKKGSFSLAIPSGSIVSALKNMKADAFDMSKIHILFLNERIGKDKCYQGAIDTFVTKCQIPIQNVYKVPNLPPAEAAAAYATIIQTCVAVETSSNGIPSVDLILLGTGEDGHCGSIYPQSKEVKLTGSGTVVYGIDEADKKSIAVSIDFMNAAKKVLVSASGSKKATMVQRALTGQFEEYGCPAALVESKSGETIWLIDTDSFAQCGPEVGSKSLTSTLSAMTENKSLILLIVVSFAVSKVLQVVGDSYGSSK